MLDQIDQHMINDFLTFAPPLHRMSMSAKTSICIFSGSSDAARLYRSRLKDSKPVTKTTLGTSVCFSSISLSYLSLVVANMAPLFGTTGTDLLEDKKTLWDFFLVTLKESFTTENVGYWNEDIWATFWNDKIQSKIEAFQMLDILIVFRIQSK